ncbi:MAG: hypothetical protein AB7G93_03140 [Bdellovibrionales bacterium]
MRTWVIIAAIGLFAAAGCSSKDKSEDTAATAPEKATEQSQAPAESKSAEAGKATPEAKTKSEATGERMECSVKGDERFLEIRKTDSGCELAYTKNGQEAVVASSVNGTSHCESTQEKIKGRLEEAGFTCK